MTFHEEKPTKAKNPAFTCIACKSDDIWYYTWESSDGAYEDYHYRCNTCNKQWWIESSDY